MVDVTRRNQARQIFSLTSTGRLEPRILDPANKPWYLEAAGVRRRLCSKGMFTFTSLLGYEAALRILKYHQIFYSGGQSQKGSVALPVDLRVLKAFWVNQAQD
jgi:hypothetical protein